MDQLIEGLGCIAVGIVLMIFRTKLAEHVIKFQNDAFKFRFGKREVEMSEFVTIVGSVFVIILGILLILGIVDWRRS